MTENTKYFINWLTFHNIVNITNAHVLKIIIKYRFCAIFVCSAYSPRKYEYQNLIFPCSNKCKNIEQVKYFSLKLNVYSLGVSCRASLDSVEKKKNLSSFAFGSILQVQGAFVSVFS